MNRKKMFNMIDKFFIYYVQGCHFNSIASRKKKLAQSN